MIRSNHPNRYLIKKAKYSIISVRDYMASSDIFDDCKKTRDDEGFRWLPINPTKIEETETLLRLLGLYIVAAGAEIGCDINYAKFYEWYDKKYPNTY